MKTTLLALAAALALAGTARADDTRVLVLPFNVLNVPESQQWIGKGVAENIVADLGRSGDMFPVSFQGAVIVEDNATAARLARNAQTSLAIRGTAQVVGNDVRLTAQILDARNGEILRTASVTGAVSNLLKLEDDLTAQLRTPATPPTPAPAAPATPIIVQQTPPQIIVVQPPTYYPPTYNYPYNYYPLGYYPASYPIIYTTPGIIHHGRGGTPGRGGPGGGGNGGRPGGGRDGGGSGRTGGSLIQVHTTSSNPTALPIPTGANLLPIPTGNIMPIPTNNVLPVPTSSGLPVPVRSVNPVPASSFQPVPALSPGTPRANAGQNRFH